MGASLEPISAERARRIPERTCVACRTVRPKRELVRIVRSPSGELVVDLRGKVPGRGAYLCPESEKGCLSKGIATGALKSALEVEISDSVRATLTEQLSTAAQERTRGGT